MSRDKFIRHKPKPHSLRFGDWLKKQHATHIPCERCGHDEFAIIDGYIRHEIPKSMPDPKAKGGRHTKILSLIVCCQNCGFIMRHSPDKIGRFLDLTKSPKAARGDLN
ncbi:hypothetical protein K8I61_01490 [bacterium]|nr:hypothetical protein [bacterium]